MSRDICQRRFATQNPCDTESAHGVDCVARQIKDKTFDGSHLDRVWECRRGTER